MKNDSVNHEKLLEQHPKKQSPFYFSKLLSKTRCLRIDISKTSDHPLIHPSIHPSMAGWPHLRSVWFRYRAQHPPGAKQLVPNWDSLELRWWNRSPRRHRCHLSQLQVSTGCMGGGTQTISHCEGLGAVLWTHLDYLWVILRGRQDLMGYLWMIQFLANHF